LLEQQRTLKARLESAELVGADVDLKALEEEYHSAITERQERSIALERLRQELADVHSKQAMAAAEEMASKRAAERLRAAHEARRGYTQGPRTALSAGISGVIGSVADLVRVT